MRKWLLRGLAALLAVSLVQPAIGTKRASAESAGPIYSDWDKYVDNFGAYKDGDFGTTPNALYVGYYKDSGGDYGSARAVLRFPLSTLPAGAVIQSATLTIPIITARSDGGVINPPYLNVYGAHDDSWTETGTDVPSYNAATDLLGASGPLTGTPPPFIINVTDFVGAEWLDAGHTASFVLTGTTAADVNLGSTDIDGSVGIYDHSHGISSELPQLQITYRINHAPTGISLSSSSVAENQPANTAVGTLSTTDQDTGDTFTYSLSSGDTTKFHISGNQLLTSDSFDFEKQSSYSVAVKTTDPYGASYTTVVPISVTNVNEAPTGLALAGSTIAENQPAGTTIGTFSATDPDTGDALTYSIIGGDAASFTIAGNALKSNEAFDYEIRDTYGVQVKVADAQNAGMTQSFTVSVTNVNEPPTDIALSSTSIDEGLASGSVVGTLSATDPDAGDTFSYAVEGTDAASFAIDGNTLKSAATLDYDDQPSYSISIKSTDGGGLAYSKPFTITVNNTNNAPTDISLTSSSVDENLAAGTTVGTLGVEDADGAAPYTYAITGGDDAASFAIDGNALKTAAVFNYEAKSAYHLSITVTDGDGADYTKPFTIAVNDVDELPTDLTLSATTVSENAPAGTAVGVLSAADPDAGASYSYEIIGGTGSEAFAVEGGQLVTASALDFETQSSYTVNIRATEDSNADTFEKLFTIAVANVNEAPTSLSLDHASIEEDQPAGTAVGTLSAEDPDAGETFEYSVEGGADAALFDISGASLVTKSPLDYEAQQEYKVLVRATDAGDLYVEKLFTITAENVNEAPTDIVLTPSSVNEGLPVGATVGTLSAVDPDAGDTFSYAIVDGDDDKFGLDADTGELVTKQIFDYEDPAAYSVDVRVTDSGGLSFTKTIPITIGDVNEAPSGLALSVNEVSENAPAGTTVGTLSATDPDAGDTLAYSIESVSDAVYFTIAGNQLKTAAVFDYETKDSYSVSIRVTDSGGASFVHSFDIGVLDANDAPTNITLTPAIVAEGQPVGTTVGVLGAADQDAGETFTYALVPGGDAASFAIAGGSLVTTAVFDYETKRDYSIDVQVTDGGGAAFVKTIAVSVSDVNEAPTAVSLSGTAAVHENEPAGTVVGTLSAVDPDAGDTFTYEITGGADAASFAIAGDVLKTAAAFDYETQSSYEVEIRATDAGGGSATQTFTIAVNDVNEAPTAVSLSGTATVNENEPAGTVVGTLSAADLDAGDTFTYEITGGADAASFAIAGDKLKTAAAFDYETQSSYEVEIRATDAEGASKTQTFTIAVNDENEAPTAVSLSGTATVHENEPAGTVVGTLSAADPDAGDTFAYEITGGADAASFAIAGDKLKTAAAFDYETQSSYEVEVRATDAGGESATQTFTIVINDANEAPTAVSLSGTAAVNENEPAGTVVGTLSAADPDAGDTFTYEITGGADAASFAIAGEELKTAAAFDYETKASYEVEIRATDAGGEAKTQLFTIVVNDANDAPIAEDLAITTNGASKTSGQLQASDADRDTLTFVIVDEPAKGDLTLDAATGAFEYDPHTGNYDTDSFTYRVNDGQLDSNVATVTVTKKRGNDAAPPPPPQKDNDGPKGSVIVERPSEGDEPPVLDISFDQDKLKGQLPEEGSPFTLNIDRPLSGFEVTVDPWLSSQLQERGSNLSVQSPVGGVTLPQSVLTDDGKVSVSLTTALPQGQVPKPGNLPTIGQPVTVQLTKDVNGDQVPFQPASGFLTIQLDVEASDGASAARPTTAVQVLPDGSYVPVPTRIVKTDDGYDVQIISRTPGTFALVSQDISFTDAHGWSQPYIEQLASRLIVNGVGNDRFDPDRGVTRAEYAAIIAKALGLRAPEVSENFEDTKPGAWYSDAIQTAVEYGLFTGYPDGSFRPNQSISRQEAFVVLFRAMSLAGLSQGDTDAQNSQALSAYTDGQQVPDWAREAVAVSTLNGWVHDDGDAFHSAQPMTREQLCYSIVQLLSSAGWL